VECQLLYKNDPNCSNLLLTNSQMESPLDRTGCTIVLKISDVSELQIYIHLDDGTLVITKRGLINSEEVFLKLTVCPKIIDHDTIESIGELETYQLLKNDYAYCEEKALVCSYLAHAVNGGDHEVFGTVIDELIDPPVYEAIFESIVWSLYKDCHVNWLPHTEMKYSDYVVQFNNVEKRLYMPRTGSAYEYFDFKTECQFLTT
jgi:hypothetical protein